MKALAITGGLLALGVLAQPAQAHWSSHLKPNPVRYKDTSARPAQGRSGGLAAFLKASQNEPSLLADVNVSAGGCNYYYCFSSGTIVKYQMKVFEACTITSHDVFGEGSTGQVSGKKLFTVNQTFSDFSGSRSISDPRIKAGMGLQVEALVRDAGSPRTAVILVSTCVQKGPDPTITLDAIDARTSAWSGVVLSARVRELNDTAGGLGHCVFFEDGAEIGRNEWVWVNRGSEVTCGLFHFFRTPGVKTIRAEFQIPNGYTDWNRNNNTSTMTVSVAPPVFGSGPFGYVFAKVKDETFTTTSVSDYSTHQDNPQWYMDFSAHREEYRSGREQKAAFLGQTDSIALPATASVRETADGHEIYATGDVTIPVAADYVYNADWTNGLTISNNYGYVWDDVSGTFLYANNVFAKNPDTGDTQGSATLTYTRFAGDVTYLNRSVLVTYFINKNDPSFNQNGTTVDESSGYFANGTFLPVGTAHTFEMKLTDALGRQKTASASVNPAPYSFSIASDDSFTHDVFLYGGIYQETYASHATEVTTGVLGITESGAPANYPPGDPAWQLR